MTATSVAIEGGQNQLIGKKKIREERDLKDIKL